MPKQLSDKPYDNGNLKRIYYILRTVFWKPFPKGGVDIIYTSSGTYLLEGNERKEIEKELGLDHILERCQKMKYKCRDKLGEELKRRLGD